MKNLEAVVHERNDAYFRLETGVGADPPQRTVTSFAGFTYKFRLFLSFFFYKYFLCCDFDFLLRAEGFAASTFLKVTNLSLLQEASYRTLFAC